MSWWRPYPVLREVIVNLKSGVAFRGIAWKDTGRYLVLTNATLLLASGDKKPVDGDVCVPREEIKYMQVISG